MCIIFKPCFVDELDVYSHIKNCSYRSRTPGTSGVSTGTVHVSDMLRGSGIFATSENKVGAHNELLIFLFQLLIIRRTCTRKFQRIE